ncbi:MAG: hypothetical protein INF43_05225 [Alphaproteobacteria bacterium]|nr:hypothetical protein [Alphaproteobacteria bacterium]
MAKLLPSPLPAGADGATVQVSATPLVGTERDEISQLVLRLKQADLRHRSPPQTPAAAPTAAAVAWAEAWQLPREVHEFFTLETAA